MSDMAISYDEMMRQINEKKAQEAKVREVLKGNTVTVQVSRSAFAQGVKRAKALGGTYNPASKTWTIPAAEWQLTNNRGGLEIVGGKSLLDETLEALSRGELPDWC